MSFITFTGIGDSYPVPRTLVQTNFAQGQVSSGTNTYAALIVGNNTSAGSAGVDGYLYGPSTTVPLQTVQDAITLFGAGSPNHIAFRDFVLRNPLTPLFVAPVASASGGVAATLTLTIAGGTATGSGTIRIFTPEGPIDTGFASGAVVAHSGSNSIVDAAVLNINANQNLPYTAAASTSSIVLTAKVVGLQGNWLRAGIIVVGSGTGLSITAPAQGFMSYFAGGSGQASCDNVISFIEGLNQRFYYIVSDQDGYSEEVVDLDAMVQLQALPATGIRQRLFAGSVDTLANAISSTTALDDPRCEIEWMQNSDWAPYRLAACAAAVYSAQEAAIGGPNTINFNFFGSTPSTSGLWGVPAPLDGTSPTQSALISAINSGITVLQPIAGGRSQILRRVTTYFYEGSVSTPDYRTRDASQVTICDFFADDLATQATLQFEGLVIGNDPPAGALPPPPSIVTPRVYRSLINNLLSQYANRALLQNVATTISDTVVVRETSPSTRISAQIPLQPIEILNQIGILVNQVTPSQ